HGEVDRDRECQKQFRGSTGLDSAMISERANRWHLVVGRGASLQPRDGDCNPIVERNRSEHQPGKGSSAFGVEEHAGDKEEPVPVRAMRPRKRGEVEGEQDWQKEKQERWFGKQHSRPPAGYRLLKMRTCCRGSASSTRPNRKPSASTSIF